MPPPSRQAQAETQESPRSRFSAVQTNVRSFLRNPIPSSVYSRSQNASAANTPRVPQLPTPRLPQLPQFAFLNRNRAPTDEENEAVLQPISSNQTRRSSTSSHSSLRHPNNVDDSPPPRPFTLWNELPEARTVALGEPLQRDRFDEDEELTMGRHPADVPLGQESEDSTQNTRRKKGRRRRRGAWIRRKNRESLWRGTARSKTFQCLISGVFLAIILAVCKYHVYHSIPPQD